MSKFIYIIDEKESYIPEKPYRVGMASTLIETTYNEKYKQFCTIKSGKTLHTSSELDLYTIYRCKGSIDKVYYCSDGFLRKFPNKYDLYEIHSFVNELISDNSLTVEDAIGLYAL